jgi:hypothetical protein
MRKRSASFCACAHACVCVCLCVCVCECGWVRTPPRKAFKGGARANQCKHPVPQTQPKPNLGMNSACTRLWKTLCKVSIHLEHMKKSDTATKGLQGGGARANQCKHPIPQTKPKLNLGMNSASTRLWKTLCKVSIHLEHMKKSDTASLGAVAAGLRTYSKLRRQPLLDTLL